MKVLFLGNDASRSGAPIGLLEFVRWLLSSANKQAHLALSAGGPLCADYRAVAPTIVLRGMDGAGRLARGAGRGVGLARRLGVAGGAQGRLEARVLGELCRDVDVIYANTIVATGPLLRVPPRLPAVLHLHEMGSSLRWLADGLADEAGL